MTLTLKGVDFAMSISANRKRFIGEILQERMSSIDASIEDFVTKLQLGNIVCLTKLYSVDYSLLTSKPPDRISSTIFIDAGRDFWYKEFAYEILRLFNNKLDNLELKGFTIRLAGSSASVPAPIGNNIEFWILPM